MNDFADRPFSLLLDDVAAERAAPGGGAAAAWTGALAAGLVEMAASLAAGRAPERMSEIRGQAAMLRRDLLHLAERDLEAYTPVLDAMRLPADDAGRARRMSEALSGAAEPPLEIAAAGADLTELAAETVRDGNPNLIGDAITAVLLAEAACRSAGALVRLNLQDRPDDPRLERLDEMLARARSASAAVPS